VAKIRAEIAAEIGTPTKVFVPQTRLPGAEAEVDWGKFDAVIGGETVTLHLFSMWLAFSTNAFHRAYVNEAQESFTDAHVRAFERFDGVPKMVRYDNLKTAATKILKGRDRTENERFIALRSHYGFESFFCEPGIAGAHEKGGVEGDIGWFRRNHLTPVPAFDTLAELNVYMADCDTADAQRWVTGRGPGAGDRVHSLAALERQALWVLPGERFTAVTRLSARVDTKARVCVRQCFYSVPARLVGQRVTVDLGAETVNGIDDGCRPQPGCSSAQRAPRLGPLPRGPVAATRGAAVRNGVGSSPFERPVPVRAPAVLGPGPSSSRRHRRDPRTVRRAAPAPTPRPEPRDQRDPRCSVDRQR
jgi:hypothetical protein